MMRNLLLSFKKIGLSLALLVAMVGNVWGATYYSRASGNWNSNTTWSLTSGGSAVGAGIFPGAGDDVVIERGYTVTINITDAECSSIQLGGLTTSTTGTLTFSGTNSSITVSGNVQLGASGSTSRDGTITFISTSTLSAGSVTLGGSNPTPGQGTITMTAGGTLSTGSLVVGAGSGTWTRGIGTIQLTDNNALPATIFTTFNNLQINSGTTTTGVAITAMTALIVKAGATFTLDHNVTSSNTTLECGAVTGSSIAGTGTLTLGGNITVNDVTTGNNGASVSAPLALSSNRTFTVADDGTSEVDLTVSSVIRNSTGTARSLTKAGAGTLVLSGTNTYSGATSVTAGILNIQNAQGTGTTAGGVSVTSGASLQLQGGITVGNEAMTLNGTGIGSTGALRNISGDNTWGGTITINSTTEITADAGLLVLDAASGNSITGSNDNIIFDGSGNVEVTDPIATGTGTLTKSGGGTLTLSGANTYTGSTTVSGGILQLGNTNSISNSSNIILSGGTFSTGESTGFSETVGTLSLSANSTISLGTDSHLLNFSNSSGVTWNGSSLTIDGWTGTPGSSGTSGKIFFGAATGTLTATQLAKINFTGYSGTPILLSTGELVPSGAASSSATDYFRTKTSGNWGSTSTWESSFDGSSWIDATLTPTDEASGIVVRTGHSVSVNVDVTIDQTDVESGATLNVNTGQTLTLNNGSGTDLTVNGSLIVNGTWINSGTTAGSGTFTFNNAGNYEHAQDGGIVPSSTWAKNSTCSITGMTATSPTGLSQTFGNFIWNCIGQTGDLSTTGNIVVSGNFTLESGTFALNNVTGYSLTIEGNYNQTGGIFDFNRGANSGQGIIYIAGNFTNTSATSSSITTNGNNAPNGKIIFNGNGVQSLNIFTSGSAQWVKYEVNAGSFVELTANLTLSSANTVTQLPFVGEFTVNGTIDFGDFSISQAGGITGSSIFTLNSGARLITSNSSGISGSISSTNMNSVLSSGANYEFQGANTGTFLTTPDAGTVNDLIVNRSGGVTLSQSIAVGGNLIFTSGFLNSSTANLISVTNTSSSSISGASATSFVNGPMRWNLPASLASGSTYSFPVGEGTTYLPFTLESPTTGTGTTTAQVEAFAANSGGSIDATLDSKSSTEYWALTTSGNFINSSVSVDRGVAISPYDVIAGATSQSGTYTSLEGNAGATGISNSDLIGSNRFFVLAEKKKNTITTGTISGSPFCQGASVSVPFTITGTYNSGNIFTVQLSDASGSFGSPVVIGTLTSTVAGTVAATIPAGASGGTGYRIRVVSSNPAVIGNDNGSNFAINVIPSAPSIGTVVQPTCDVATGSATLNGLPSGTWTLTMNPGDVKTTGTGSSTTITNLAPGTYSFTVSGEDESTACPGSGNGLKGEYFNVMDLLGTPVLTRTDATVNFNWGSGTPGVPVSINNFSVRWSGKIQACYTETYTFTTRSDDGIRLWVNGIQIINNWTDHSATNNSGNISLVAGQKYDIVLEFYENGGDAVSQLSWSCPSEPTSVIIPQSQLYSEATGCTSVASANVVINSQPSVPAAPTSVTPSSATSICTAETINLNATSAGNTIYWFTQASGGTSIGTSTSGANFSVSPVANTTYYAEAQSSSGCISATRTATGLITVTANLSAVALSPASQQNICTDGSGSQITVTETNGGTISVRQWGKRSVSGGAITNIAGATGATYTPTGADLGSGTWYLVCTSTPTCGSAMTSNEIIVVVSESIGGTLSGGVTPTCLGSSTGTLTLTGYTGTIKNWERRLDGGSWTYITNSSATYSEIPSSAGTWQYRAVVQNGSCNVANSSEISIVVDPVSVGGGVYDGTTPICLNSSTGTMNLRAGYVGNVVRWEKRVDGGAWSNIANTSTSYSENPSIPGTWEYRALVQSGSCNAVYSTAFSVVVNPELTITLGTNPDVCQTVTTTSIPYSATTGSPEGWVLTFNAAAISANFSSPQNGSLSSAPGNIPVNVPYNVEAGVYQANLKLIKYTPVCSSVDYPVTITVSASQSAGVTIVASSNPVCSGTSVTYTATPTNGGTTPTYQWKVNGSNVGINSATYSYIPANGDEVTCVLTSSTTCASGNPATSNSVTMIVNAELPVSVSIATNTNPVCAGSGVTFTATPVNGGETPEFQWKVNGNDVGTNSATYSYIPVNGDVVTCRLASDVNCATGNPATSNTITMTVNPIPAVTNSPTKTICNGSSTNISPTATVPSTFSWTIGTITGGITGASAGAGSSINQVLNNPSNSAAGSVQYVVTPTSTSGSCGGSPFTITVTVQSINVLVTDISDEIGSDCPDFGDFNPNTASYNPGYSVVKFRVERDLSASAWSFDYNLTGGVVYSGSPEVASATKSIALGTNSVDMVFYVANTPGAAQNIVFKVVNVSDSNCSNNGINRTVTHTILAMPAIGSFN